MGRERDYYCNCLVGVPQVRNDLQFRTTAEKPTGCDLQSTLPVVRTPLM